MDTTTTLRGRKIEVTRPFTLGPREILLTFDDGPSDGPTADILATLEQFGLPAIFFMIGEPAMARPSMARRVADAGHVVGSHTMTHPHLTALPRDEAEAEIDNGHAAVETVLGTPLRLFRFPFLDESPELRRSVEARGLTVLDVDIICSDWEPQTAGHLLDYSLAQIDRAGSGILLLHDVHDQTAGMLPHLLQELQRRDYSIAVPVLPIS